MRSTNQYPENVLKIQKEIKSNKERKIQNNKQRKEWFLNKIQIVCACRHDRLDTTSS